MIRYNLDQLLDRRRVIQEELNNIQKIINKQLNQFGILKDAIENGEDISGKSDV